MTGLEIERKLIIKIPDEKLLSGLDGYTESKIEQIYLSAHPPFSSHRVRRREYSDGRVLFFETAKRRVGAISAEEYERQISAEEYEALATGIEEGTRPVIKTRKTFPYCGKVFEIDIYPEWKSTCIMEVELLSENETVAFPPFTEIVCEVSGRGEYSNHAMSKKFPPEIK